MLKFIGMTKKTALILAFFLLNWLCPGNFAVAASAYPNDTYIKNQWYLGRIGFNQVWSKKLSNKEVVVAVIDSGVDIDHPDLVDRIWKNRFEINGNKIDDDKNGFIDDVYGWDFILNTPDPRPKMSSNIDEGSLNHGTMVAGIIAASVNNGLGIAGISQNAKIMPLRSLDERGEGRISDVIRAIDYAINNGADIINLSFTGLEYNQGFKEAIERAYKAGVIVVAAAGNNSEDLSKNPLYPACFKGPQNENIIISVSATNTLDQRAYFSAYSSACVDISAPGISFFSTSFYNPEKELYHSYDGYWSGTSMSAALISGSLALIKEANPKLSNKELSEILLKSADNINALNPDFVNHLGSGRVNVANSVNWALEKLDNISPHFLLFPQSGGASFKSTKLLKTTSENEDINFNTLRLVKRKGVEKEQYSVYGQNFSGTINMINADLDNNGSQEIILGAGFGSGPQVMILDQKFNVINQFFAYEEKFRGGVNVAVGDVDGDGQKEIITAAGAGGGPHIRIFDAQGNLKGQFFAYDAKFSGGVNIAVGELKIGSPAKIICVPASQGEAHVKIFNGQGILESHFFAYENRFANGATVQVANIFGKDSKENKEIIVAPNAGREPEIRIFDFYGQRLGGFLAYAEKFKNGVNLAVGDLDKDGLAEIITGAGPGGTPHVRAFSGKGELKESFYGLEADFSGGVKVGFIELIN